MKEDDEGIRKIHREMLDYIQTGNYREKLEEI